MKKVFINISSRGQNLHNYIVEAFLGIQKKHDLIIYNFAETESAVLRAPYDAQKIQDFHLVSYDNKEHLFQQIDHISKTHEISYINTFAELLIPLANECRKHIGQEVTEQYELFRNKKLQRELFQKYDESIGIKF